MLMNFCPGSVTWLPRVRLHGWSVASPARSSPRAGLIPSTKETRALLVDDRRQRFLGGADRELKAAVSMGYARGKFEPRDEIQRLATSGTPS
jgi:hypothetical protein